MLTHGDGAAVMSDLLIGAAGGVAATLASWAILFLSGALGKIRILRKRDLLARFGDEAVALSEQLHQFSRRANSHLGEAKSRGMEPTPHDKAQIAVSYMRERCVELGISATDADLRKIMEIRLSMSRPVQPKVEPQAQAMVPPQMKPNA